MRTIIRKAVSSISSIALAIALVPSIGFVAPQAAEAATGAPSLKVTRASTGTVTIKKGASYSLGVTASGEAKIAYSSSKKTVATVSSKGVVKGKRVGKATITITAKKNKVATKKKVKVTVLKASQYKPVKKITAKAAKSSLAVGATTSVRVTFNPSAASNKNVIYKSSSSKVLAVSSTGKVTAKAVGSAKITIASCDNARARATVTLRVKKASNALGAVHSITYVTNGGMFDGTYRDSFTETEADFSLPSPVRPGYVFAGWHTDEDCTMLLQKVSKGTSDDLTLYAKWAESASERDEYLANADSVTYDVAKYADGVIAVDPKEAAASSDGTSLTFPASLDSKIVKGSVVAALDDYYQGRAVKVSTITDNGNGTVTVSGEIAEPEEIFEELHLEGTEIINKEELAEGLVDGVELIEEDPSDWYSIDAETSRVGALSTNTLTQRSTWDLGTVSATVKLTNELLKSYGITSSGDFKVAFHPIISYGVEWKGPVPARTYASISSSTAFKGDISVNAETDIQIWPNPGISSKKAVEAGIYLHFSAEGDITFNVSGNLDVGFDTDRGGLYGNADMNGELTAQLKGDFGPRFKVVVTIANKPVVKTTADVGIEGTVTRVQRSVDFYCVDAKAYFVGEVAYNVASNISKYLKFSESAKWKFLDMSSNTTWTKHLENGAVVYECTWGTRVDNPEPIIPTDAFPYSGHNYCLFSAGTCNTFDEAKKYCESLGGHLATITTAEENDALHRYITSLGVETAYFGLTDRDTEGKWEWVTGESVDYQNWHSGEPNAENRNEDYAEFYWKYTDGTWNDGDWSNLTASDSNAFICEWDTIGTASSSDLGITRRSSLEEYSWAEIKAIANALSGCSNESEAIVLATSYGLTQPDGTLNGTETKTFTLKDGTETQVQIMGFWHDELTAGGKAGITFGFKEIVGSHVMNSTSTNEGGWSSTEMRAYLNNEFYDLLPNEVKSCIVSVNKRTNNIGHVDTEDASVVTTSNDKIWLPGLSECYGELPAYIGNVPVFPSVYGAEGEQYKLYKDNGVTTSNNSFLQKNIVGTTSSNWWWLRSPYLLYDISFLYVDPSGNWYNTYYVDATYSYGVSPGFCM